MKILLQLWLLTVFCPIALGEGNKGRYSEESPATHKGTHRQTRADPCASSPCLHGGFCTTKLEGTFQCTCQKLWTGARCERCLCQNGGRCDYSPSEGNVCRCQAGFIGTKCDTEENECDSYPCWNGICIDLVNDYKCVCDPGYTGKDCDVPPGSLIG
ncbi:fibropellin-1 [Lingula anatina]|uniref:Fibropellin-1 n=1 Tax=Lingula anatina TaxID=7574 RepID=A0A1S3HYU3_LINAN|nr:fibropellin-1 [Lingula anatina]|eukprot:XP_013390741.1 fibropellin-1 [Lingula anatina]